MVKMVSFSAYEIKDRDREDCERGLREPKILEALKRSGPYPKTQPPKADMKEEKIDVHTTFRNT